MKKQNNNGIGENYIAITQHLIDDKNLPLLQKFILAIVEDYNRNGKQCYMTNEQFAEMCGVERRTIMRAINDLDSWGYIIKEIKTVAGNGRANKQRVITSKLYADKQ